MRTTKNQGRPKNQKLKSKQATAVQEESSEPQSSQSADALTSGSFDSQSWLAVEAALRDKRDLQLSRLKAIPEVNQVLERMKLQFQSLVPARESSTTGEPLTKQEQQLYQMQRDNTLDALRICASLTREIVECKRAIQEIHGSSKRASSSNEKLYCDKALAVVREKLQGLRSSFEEVSERSPEAYYVVHSRAFRRYSRQLLTGRIAITPFVEGKMEELIGILRGTGMAMLHGPTGSGKSEVAEMVGWRFSSKKPLTISGHRDVSAREFRGHDQLQSSGRASAWEIPGQIEAAKQKYRELHPTAAGIGLSAALKQIEQRILRDNAVTESQFILGYAYTAAKEGRALIIDEFNLIDPKVLMGLNSLMTKKEGQMVDVPEDGHPPFKVAAGFCIILTGNLNSGEGARYHERWEPDASTVNRFLPVEYGFLPQITEGSAAQAKPKDKQLYQVILSTLRSGRPKIESSDLAVRIEDRAMVANLPGGAEGLEQLWRLAKLAAITQLALEGKATQDSPYAHTRNGVKQTAEVSHALTPRVVVNLLHQWMASGFEFELDHYVFKALIDSSLTAMEKDYFYRVAQLQGFFTSPGWPEVKDDGSESLYSHVRSPRNPRSAEPETVPGRVLIREIYGDAPKRATWPTQEKSSQEEAKALAAEVTQQGIRAELLLGEVAELLASTQWVGSAKKEKR